ncbi:hypothetical protein [Microbacterium sp. Bi128]|uniref:hypothetical protein n=1 Tax=Microbacterium sp. Bi128 TaxID=2821115 RepID=UPI001D616621|nr:hypothetical protein [Microbacterium sp. Bi128]CAH0163351.1 hypothetical protein SRABI128_00844 [Microbacterium sp. Bi128]
MNRAVRWLLVVLHAMVSLTAIAGGTILVLGALDSGFASTWEPAADYLEGSPFSSYLVPGLVLVLFLGGLQGLASVMQVRASRGAPLVSAVAGLVMFVWIFVQMMYIPFSVLQAVYFVIALVQVAAVLIDSDVLTRAVVPGVIRTPPRTRRAQRG